jgi:cytochrome c oxidase cbb3-type subunit 2
MINPRDVVPESVMPVYPHLMHNTITPEYIADFMRANRLVGVPYTDEMIESAEEDFVAQADPFGDHGGLLERYHGAQTRNFDGQPELTEMDALIAYMQVIGTLVDFDTFVRDASR